MNKTSLPFLMLNWRPAVTVVALLLASCGHRSVNSPNIATDSQLGLQQAQAHVVQRSARYPDVGIYFDEAYLDSLSHPPFSAQTQRQYAIMVQLGRLQSEIQDDKLYEQGKLSINDSIRVGADSPGIRLQDAGVRDMSKDEDTPLMSFRNRAAYLAYIYRKIDSLKVLEGRPLTPWPTDPRHAFPSTSN